MRTIAEQPNMQKAIHIAKCIGALSIEVSTGLRHSKGSVLKTVQQLYGVKARRKVQAIEELKQQYQELTGWAYGAKR